MRRSFGNFGTCALEKAQRVVGSMNVSSLIYLGASTASVIMSQLCFLIIIRFKLLYPDWRGYLIAGFALVWMANVYMSLFARIRLDVKRERVQIKKEEEGAK